MIQRPVFIPPLPYRDPLPDHPVWLEGKIAQVFLDYLSPTILVRKCSKKRVSASLLLLR
jgi:hypothetical protein